MFLEALALAVTDPAVDFPEVGGGFASEGCVLEVSVRAEFRRHR